MMAHLRLRVIECTVYDLNCISPIKIVPSIVHNFWPTQNSLFFTTASLRSTWISRDLQLHLDRKEDARLVKDQPAANSGLDID